MKRPSTQHRRGLRITHTGFSILEVLIAIVILSLGVLGTLGMQVSALQSNKEVRYQSIAITFARELAEKMRGNHAVAIKTNVADNPYLLDLTLSETTAITIPADTDNCFKTACTDGKKMGEWDVADWKTRLKAALPTPRVVVCFDKTPFTSGGKTQWTCSDDGDVVVVKMAWTRTNTAGQLEFADGTGIPLVVIPLTAGSSE